MNEDGRMRSDKKERIRYHENGGMRKRIRMRMEE